MNIKISFLATTLFACGLSTAIARDTISVVGSSTVYPFATVVSEYFGKNSDFKSPKVESTGSGGGIKLFCKGLGVATPDVTNASRRMKKSEFDKCQANGVKDIVEVLIGYDGIVLANIKSQPQMSLSRKDIYLALAKQVPGKDGKLMENSYKTWNEINSALPNKKIEVLGPPPTSGTRDAFVELVLEGGAKQVPEIGKLAKLKSDKQDEIAQLADKLGIKAIWDGIVAKKGKKAKGKDLLKIISHPVREDGAYIEAGENDNLIVNKLVANPSALGIFGFSFLDQNLDSVQGSIIDGQIPEFEAIVSGDYVVSRPLYFYVKKAHIGTIPGIKEYIEAFVSEEAIGEDGYLIDRGLIPLDGEQLETMSESATSLTNLSL